MTPEDGSTESLFGLTPRNARWTHLPGRVTMTGVPPPPHREPSARRLWWGTPSRCCSATASWTKAPRSPSTAGRRTYPTPPPCLVRRRPGRLRASKDGLCWHSLLCPQMNIFPLFLTEKDKNYNSTKLRRKTSKSLVFRRCPITDVRSRRWPITNRMKAVVFLYMLTTRNSAVSKLRQVGITREWWDKTKPNEFFFVFSFRSQWSPRRSSFASGCWEP